MRATSPNGKLDAVLFQRDCGATTSFSTQVSIVSHGEAVSGSGSVFRADDDHGAARSGSWGGPWAELEWVSPIELRIRYAVGSGIFAQERSVKGISISYQQARF